MTAPAVSVIIPTHDRPHLLREALASVLENDFSGELEIIVSDDSPSGSGQFVVEAAVDPRIRYVHPGPGTKSGNWQSGLAAATGRYVFKLDDDDRILPGFLERCAAWLDQEPAIASVYTGHRIRREGDERVEEIIDTAFFGPTGRVSGAAYWRGVLTNVGGYPRNQKTAGMFRREAAERLGGYRHASEDFVFSAALGLFGDVGYIPEVLYEWRIHGGSGVRNLERTWQLSDEACDGALQLPHDAVSESVRDEWQRAIMTARRALPLFYLRAAFDDGGVREGWSFWNVLRRDGASAWSLVTLAALVGATVTPRGVRRTFFRSYQKSPQLQRFAAWCLAKGDSSSEQNG